jgi:para-nitrobenzyl esterase
VQALLTDEMWVRPVVGLAEAHSAAGGRAWLSRWDHAPGLAVFDAVTRVASDPAASRRRAWQPVG